MKFSELIQTPDVTLNQPEQVAMIVTAFNQVSVVFNVGADQEVQHKLQKPYPIGDNDLIYESLKRFFKMNTDFMVIQGIPYQDLPETAVQEGVTLGVYFLSNEVRMGGYGRILSRTTRKLVNKGEILIDKDALLVSFPTELKTINRRRRYRVPLRVEEHYCEIGGFPSDRHSPIPRYTVRNLSPYGASIVIPQLPPDITLKENDLLLVRISLFTPQKGYHPKRTVVVSQQEITAGSVQEELYVLKCKVLDVQQPNERTLVLGLHFLGIAIEAVTTDPKKFSALKYDPIDGTTGIERMIPWLNRIQQARRAEEKDLLR
ncbi:MAG TPA: hypothetical protein PLG59_09455 [bacterium]|nr:hypothetical protein [bacterium]HQO34876.1 hypothetical protein [bacterium]HQP99561.1 hypothetical protein [bacterium]